MNGRKKKEKVLGHTLEPINHITKLVKKVLDDKYGLKKQF
jgi:hypothetical protein